MGERLLDRGDARMSLETFRRLAVDQYKPSIEAGVGSVMISYSSFNGVKMHQERYLITTVLKKELGFNGFVVSDWKGIDDIPGDFNTDVAASINAGIDMVMVPDRYEELIEAIKTLVPGKISEARINDAVSRILAVKCEMGLFDEGYNPKTDRSMTAELGSPEHRAVARQAVRQSLVLLQNENHRLPLKKNLKIHVAGTKADDLDAQCGGWTITWKGSGSRTEGTSILEAVKKEVGPENVSYSKDATSIPANTEAIIAVVGETPYAEWEGDRNDLSLFKEDILVIDNAAAADLPTVVVLLSGRPMIITPHLDKADAWVAAWLPGTEGEGVADVLFGDAAPTGKLTHSWPKSMRDIPTNKEDLSYAPLFPYGFGLSYD
jgi:beta-glucosidase